VYLFLIFLFVPIVEIALFIQVGGLLGLWPTIAIILLTAFAATILLRQQFTIIRYRLGNIISDLSRSDQSLSAAEPLLDIIAIFAAALCLLTPGFLTDTVGFLLLFIPTRRLTYRFIFHLIQRYALTRVSSHPDTQHKDILDVEYEEIRPPNRDMDISRKSN